MSCGSSNTVGICVYYVCCILIRSGVSGPAALKLSAFGARELHDHGYKGQLKVNWVRAAVANEAEALEAFKKVFSLLNI
jgi:predicted flavoprotein YhiN